MLRSAARPHHWRNGCARALGFASRKSTRGRAGAFACAGLAVAMLVLAGEPVAATAQAGKPDRPKAVVQPPQGVQARRAKLNQETLVVAAGRPGSSYMTMAVDLAAAVAAAGGVRLLPVATAGGSANLDDLLFLRGVDLAIVPANVLAHAMATHTLGAALPHRIAYVTALYSESVHVVAGRGIAALADLGGKRVAVPSGDATVEFTAGDILKRLGIAVETAPMPPTDALEAVREGRIAAVVLLGGKPLASVAALPKDGSLHLLSVPAQALPGEAYVPAVFVAEDYPALIPPGVIVDTVAVGTMLMASKTGDEARRIARHTPALLTAIGALAAAGHQPRWRDVNLGTVLPGWFRVEAAERWLEDALAQRKLQLRGAPPSPRAPKPVRSTVVSAPKAQKKLLDDFEAWVRQSEAAQADPK